MNVRRVENRTISIVETLQPIWGLSEEDDDRVAFLLYCLIFSGASPSRIVQDCGIVFGGGNGAQLKNNSKKRTEL